jgi:hypothetical protein
MAPSSDFKFCTVLYFKRINESNGDPRTPRTTNNGTDTVRILRFLEKVALTPGGGLSSRVLRSQAKPVGQSKGGAKEMSTRQSYVRALKAAGLLDCNDGAFSNWMHRFGEHDIGCHIDERLGLEEGTYGGKSRSRTRI